MADTQPQSIADRIAALKINQVGLNPNGPKPSRPRPPPPPRPTLPGRSNSSNAPTQDRSGVANQPQEAPRDGIANGMDGISRPALPPRTSTPSSQTPTLPPRRGTDSPALPPRRPSETPSLSSRAPSETALSRRDSDESVSSIATARSGISTGTSQSDRFSIRAPSFDASTLPALPPKRTQEDKDADFKKYNNRSASSRSLLQRKSSAPSVQPKQVGTTPPPLARPAVRQTGSRPSQSDTIHEEPAPARIEPPPRQRTTAPPPRQSALSLGLNKSTNTPPPVPTSRPGSVSQSQNDGAAPPPIPTGSRPDLGALQSSKPKMNGNATPQPSQGPVESCLLCRDYSGPDNHAARFPRESIPSQDIGWLAHQLTAPFDSLTDKARALFTWLHHNIAYDTVSFFGGNVKSSTPQGTLASGLAVCEGYAGLFSALAVKAGLEAYVISGHGKGYGYSKLKPGEPIPPPSPGHAWNAVKIDGGHWKLIDCCWGAGNVNNQTYNKHFSPERFTQSNDDFGRDHYPMDPRQQLRNDGTTLSWEEYMLSTRGGCAGNFCSGFVSEEGLSAPSFAPTSNPINPAACPGPTLRFSFQKCCPHWDPVRCGKGPYYMYVLHLESLEGTPNNDIPFDSNGDVWWCDVPVRDLGRSGQKARIYALTQFNGKDARGFRKEQWVGRVGSWQYASVCTWDIA